MLIRKKITNNFRITGFIVAIMLIFSLCSYYVLSLRGEQSLNQRVSDDISFLGTLNKAPMGPGVKVPMETPILPFGGFIKNLGQVSDDLLSYYFSTGEMTVGFAPSEIKFAVNSPKSISPVYYSLTFPGSHKVLPIGYEKQAHYINFFYGNFQQTNVPTYKEVWYYNLYPGIDLRYYMSLEGLKYEFVVQPGADPNLITIEADSSTDFIIEDQSVLFQKLQSKGVFLKDTQLKVFQQDGETISASFEVRGTEENRYGFRLSTFDHSQSLVIDPLMLSFSTYLGGSGYDYAYDVVVDVFNNTYVIGTTDSVAFPITSNALNTSFNGGTSDVFITKLNPVGSSLVYSTYLGGNSEDSGFSIAVDLYNNTYITGKTSSTNFPVTSNAINSSLCGETDIFVTKLNGTGNKLEFSTYLGGNDLDSGSEIIVDAFNNAYITGETASLDFPTTPGAIDDTHNGGVSDVFVVKINSAGDNLVFSTYVGGEGNDYGYAIAIDEFNNTYITGETWSSNFPTLGAYDDSLLGNTDVFITKINHSGKELIYSTFLGGGGVDYGYGIAVDAYNNTYITGKTMSSNFPLKNEYSNYGGYFDAFVTKIKATGSDLEFSTYLGGIGEDSGHAIVVDSYNYTYITGRTSSSDFAITSNAFNRIHSGSYDAFVTKINPNGNELSFSTFLGGSGEDAGHAIAVDSNNETYIAGHTRSSNFPTYNAYSDSFGGTFDGIVAKLTIDDKDPVITLISPTEGTVNNSGMVINVTVSDTHLTNAVFNWDGEYNQTWNEGYLFRLPWGDGEHTLYIYAYDRAGNWASETFTFVTDNTPPFIYLRSPGDLTYPSIIVDIGGDAQHYWYKIEGVDGTNQTWTSKVTRSLDNGTYTLHAFGNDSIGNEAHTSVTFTIDTSFALVVIDSPLNTTFKDNTTTVTLSGDAVPMWYYISGFHDENQTYITSVSHNLTDGTYILHAFGNNSVNNVTHVSVIFTIDTIPPIITINSPLNSTITTDNIFVNLSGDADHYWYRIQRLPDNGFTNQTWNSLIQHYLSNGTYILHAYGNDTAGNEAHASVIFTIDTTSATVIIDSPLSITYATSTIIISLSGDALFYTYWIPGAVDTETVWITPVTYTIQDGTYTLYATGFKTMGKITYVNVTFTIDTTPPTIMIDSPQSTIYTTGNITINVSDLSDAQHYWYYIEGIDSENQTWSSSITRSNIPNGNYTLHIYGNDSVNNVAHANVTFTMQIPIPTSLPSVPLTTYETTTTITSST
ncbi:MAG: SBBP repeat-containing protein, partial [Promethearchaeota archaeon]